jgi:hypothetical protein
MEQLVLRNKPEIRSTKSETNSNDKNLNDQNERNSSFCFEFWTFGFWICFEFRISCFGFYLSKGDE